jgi:hypothetical protein
MLTVAPKPIERPAGPPCYRCGTDTRLFGIESHPTIERADLRTYVCSQCDGLQTEVVPLRRWTT